MENKVGECSPVSRFARVLSAFALLFAMAALSGCYLLQSTTIPIETMRYEWEPGQRQERLLVYLVGMKDAPIHFEEYGLWDRLKSAGIPCDVVAVNSHFGYYRDRSLTDRLRIDVIQPAREQGYSEFWVVGNSLGGLGSIILATEMERSELARVFLLAPFLGKDENVLMELMGEKDPEDWTRRGPYSEEVAPLVWGWLKDYRREGASRPELYLGYGDDDKLAPWNDQLARLLPSNHVFLANGGHKWKVWAPLWTRLLEQVLKEEELNSTLVKQ